MAASEHQTQSLVRYIVQPLVWQGIVQAVLQQVALALEGGFTPKAIDQVVLRRAHDPAPRVVWHPPLWPRAQGDQQRFLDGVFRQVEAADRPDESGVNPPRLLSEQSLDCSGQGRAGSCQIGRTSIVP